MALPDGYQERKAIPLWDFMFGYFPDAWLAVVDVAVAGDRQHNPGEADDKTIHWAREKSRDQLNTAMRHLFDYGQGRRLDNDGVPHIAKAIWRLMAQLQLDIEREKSFTNAPIISTDNRDGHVSAPARRASAARPRRKK